MLKFEKPYEIMEGWEKFVESEFEREITVSNITFSEIPVVSQEIEAPKIQGSEATSVTSTKKTTEYYINARGNLHSIDFETERDEDIYVSTGLEKISSKILEANISKRKLKGLQPAEIVVVPTKHEGEERRKDALKRKQRKLEKYLKTRKRRRAQKQLIRR